MQQQFCGLTFLVTLAMWTSGCSLVQPAQSYSHCEHPGLMGMEELREIEAVLVESDASVPKLDPSQLQVGQHVRILTGSLPETLHQEVLFLTSGIVGTVKSACSDHIILHNVVVLSERRTQHAVPIAGSLPYFNRLFKHVSIGREVTPVPGEVTIKHSEIMHARELTDARIEELRQYRVERIGADFDFNVEDGRTAATQQVQ